MYEALSQFAQTWGLLLFVLLFAGVLVYALWPGNRERFNQAAQMPLDDAEGPEGFDTGKGRNHG
ncbi:MAG: CcoQ/FixQ family Cbb3-type cytochrome c oxidase assembly chaperone [Alphaproteobacteria bacterium]|nr:CcoQ/FixQ family Cbb3-type cytochrome c oxidase assembly chaperone [Alphaproteobacteria bacterium]